MIQSDFGLGYSSVSRNFGTAFDWITSPSNIWAKHRYHIANIEYLRWFACSKSFNNEINFKWATTDQYAKSILELVRFRSAKREVLFRDGSICAYWNEQRLHNWRRMMYMDLESKFALEYWLGADDADLLAQWQTFRHVFASHLPWNRIQCFSVPCQLFFFIQRFSAEYLLKAAAPIHVQQQSFDPMWFNLNERERYEKLI